MGGGDGPVRARMSQGTAPARLPRAPAVTPQSPGPAWQYDNLLSVKSLSANRGGDSSQCSASLLHPEPHRIPGCVKSAGTCQ